MSILNSVVRSLGLLNKSASPIVQVLSHDARFALGAAKFSSAVSSRPLFAHKLPHGAQANLFKNPCFSSADISSFARLPNLVFGLHTDSAVGLQVKARVLDASEQKPEKIYLSKTRDDVCANLESVTSYLKTLAHDGEFSNVDFLRRGLLSSCEKAQLLLKANALETIDDRQALVAEINSVVNKFFEVLLNPHYGFTNKTFNLFFDLACNSVLTLETKLFWEIHKWLEGPCVPLTNAMLAKIIALRTNSFQNLAQGC